MTGKHLLGILAVMTLLGCANKPEQEVEALRLNGNEYPNVRITDADLTALNEDETAILDTYNSAMVQPNPLFSGEMNCLANKLLSIGVTDIHQTFPEETAILDGEDIAAQVQAAWNFLVEHAFVM